MTLTIAQAIKQRIAVNLQTLITNGIINSFVSLDQRPNAITDTPPNGYPFAIIGMPSMKSDYEDTASNLRTYTFSVLVVVGYENMPDVTIGVEGIMDNFANVFDTDFTLAGAAIGAQVPPVQIEAMPITMPDKTFVTLVATITARSLYTLGS